MTTQLRIRIIACLFLLTPFLSFAQVKPDYYTARWKTVDSLVNIKGLPQSALAQVNLIYEHARQEKNEPQLLKALIYRVRLQHGDQEDADVKSIADLEKEIPGTPQPAKSILQNILAGSYQSYYQQHRYQLYDRTRTVDFIKDSIATWSADDFHKKIGDLYLASLAEEKLLSSTRLDIYDPLIVKGNTRSLRPTLFDLLAHHALDYFKSGERDLSRPAYVFEIDDPAAFGDAVVFAKHTFSTADTSSLHYKALLLFQRLIGLHLGDAKPDALLDVDIERLNFVHTYATMENKDELYASALANITNKWPDVPAAAEAWHLQAVQHFNKAGRYDPPQDTSGRWEYAAAKAICEKVIAQKDSSEGRINCEGLLRQILYKSLELKTESVNVPGQPFRSLVKWRNLTRLYIRIVRFDHTTREGLGNNTYQDSYWQKLLQLPVVRTFAQALPRTGDYQTHRTEMSIEGLPVGGYALIASDDSAFRLGQHIMALTNLYVSNIAYINNGLDYFIVDRSSGQPVSAASVQVWEKSYDYKVNRLAFSKAETYRTDGHGHFIMKKREGQRNNNVQIALEISAGQDRLF
ncbi:MAG TPA: hypothetical protein VHC48_20585, partial [Puia sp.]|nr:hypothetical protein [Puia sp.]